MPYIWFDNLFYFFLQEGKDLYTTFKKLLLSIYLFPLLLFCDGPLLPWVVYYNNKAPSEAFSPYNPIVLDSVNHPPLKPLFQEDKIILGYLNLGEAEDRYDWFQNIKETSILIQENPNFKGSWAVDIRNPIWTTLILDKLIPEIIKQGFSGIFMDQVDISLDLEKKNPQKYKGMAEAAIHLIKAIHKKYPEQYLMLNRAYDILLKVGKEIDFELAETLYTNYNFETKKYFVRPKNEFEAQLLLLNRARFLFPRLTVFSLDYWDPKDLEMVRKIYSIERKEWMRAYVSTPTLDEIYSEP